MKATHNQIAQRHSITPIIAFSPTTVALSKVAANHGELDNNHQRHVLIEEISSWAILAAALVLEAVLVNLLWLS